MFSLVVLFSPHSGRKSRPHGPEDKVRRTEKIDYLGKLLIRIVYRYRWIVTVLILTEVLQNE